MFTILELVDMHNPMSLAKEGGTGQTPLLPRPQPPAKGGGTGQTEPFVQGGGGGLPFTSFLGKWHWIVHVSPGIVLKKIKKDGEALWRRVYGREPLLLKPYPLHT